MNVMPTVNKDTAALIPPRARVGLIIPSVNTFSEPQFNHFAPDGLGIHVARARVAGEWKRPLPEMKDEIADAAKLLSDAQPGRHRVPLHRHVDDAGTAGRRKNPRHRHGSDRHRRDGDEPPGARGAADARHEEGGAAHALQEQQGRDRLSHGRGRRPWCRTWR